MSNTEKKSFIKYVPNILTVARLILTVFFLWMVLVSDEAENRPLFLTIAFIFFVVTGLTDIVDGFIARRYNAVSKFGRIVDPLADKFLVVGAFVCFAIIGRPTLFDLGTKTLAVIQWGTVVLLVVRELTVTLIRQWAESRHIKFPASWYGKLKMFTQSFAIGTVLVKMGHLEKALWANWFTAIVYAIMLFATLVSGLEAVIRVIQHIKKEK